MSSFKNIAYIHLFFSLYVPGEVILEQKQQKKHASFITNQNSLATATYSYRYIAGYKFHIEFNQWYSNSNNDGKLDLKCATDILWRYEIVNFVYQTMPGNQTKKNM